ncbi:hypothetical protein IQ243_28890 [Nostocales cyanobacterium LEGE 11386]|nr:hypothetical protein [Nostocales cyanobacterium LEGE 11386]
MLKLAKSEKFLRFFLSLTVTTATLTNLAGTVNANNVQTKDWYKLKQETQVEESKNVVLSKDERLNFQLHGCTRNNKSSTVVCSLLVTNVFNRDEDLRVGAFKNPTIDPIPRVFDFSGNEYSAKFVKLGERESDNAVITRIIQRVPIKLLINFEVPPDVGQLTILEVNYRFIGNSKAEFRNVDIAEIATNTKPSTSGNQKK